MMMVDAFEPEGFTALAKDSIFMMPHLGVLATVHPKASLEVFERDCLIYLGSCVAVVGQGKPGNPCFSFSVRGEGIDQTGQMLVGEIRLIPLLEGATASVTIEPERGFDCGGGPGRSAQAEVHGGTVGIVLDARGRPLSIPPERSKGRPLVAAWVRSMGLYESAEPL
jgi:hypothetical protein